MNEALILSDQINKVDIEKKSLRQGFGDALVEQGEKIEDIIVLTADLMESTKTDGFAKKFPSRFIEVGIAEQNMAGISVGLALSGKMPFMTSYTEFSPGRNWEQIKISICYSNANVKICSSHAGFSASFDGAQHQGLEDLALTRVLPNMVVIAPADYFQAKKAVEIALKQIGPVYIRLQKNESPVFTTEKTNLEFGKAQVLKEGNDLTIIGCGPIIYEALLAALDLEKNGISVEVINSPFVKPLDEETILTSTIKTKKVITIEEHQKACGFGSAVCELLSEKNPVTVLRMGVDNSFGESGSYEDLLKKHKLTKDDIIRNVKSLLTAHENK